MKLSPFEVLNMGVGGLLFKARRAAYASAMRIAGKGHEVPWHHDINWSKHLDDAEEFLTSKLDRCGNIPEDEVQAVWMAWGITRVYVGMTVEGSVYDEPMKWEEWLKSAAGLKSLKKFPLDKYDALLRKAQHERKNQDRHFVVKPIKTSTRKGQDSRKSANKEKVEIIAGTSSPVLSLQPTVHSNSQSTGIVSSLNTSDVLLNVAQFAKNQYGVRIEDNRGGGGALWVNHLTVDDDLAKKLQAAKFRFHSVRGWWAK